MKCALINIISSGFLSRGNFFYGLPMNHLRTLFLLFLYLKPHFPKDKGVESSRIVVRRRTLRDKALTNASANSKETRAKSIFFNR